MWSGNKDMSASKVRHKFVQILDFSKPKLSKRYVAKVLKAAPFDGVAFDAHTGNITCTEHEVKVGVYKIHIILPFSLHRQSYKHLRDYKKINIDISMIGVSDLEEEENKKINLLRDKLFVSQKWAWKNSRGGWISIKDLIDAILYCSRLSRLKAFL